MAPENLTQSGTPFLGRQGITNRFRDPTLVEYFCEFNPSFYEDTLFSALAIPHHQSLNRAVVKRKAEFLAGRYCARNALVSLGIENATVGIGASRNPLWPSGVTGSISHSHQVATAIVCSSPEVRGVGIDVEHLVEPTVLNQIQNMVINQDELALLTRSDFNATEIITLLFSIKESFFKAAYPIVKKYFGFNAVSVIEIKPEIGEACFRINTDLHDSLPEGHFFNARYVFSGLNTLTTLVLI